MFSKVLLVIAIFGCCAFAAEDASIVSQESEVLPEGKYHYKFETSDGTKAEQDGELHGTGEEAGNAIHGSYTYHSDDGQTFNVEYTADENGYQPHGEHIHAIPELIQRALTYIEQHPYVEEKKH